MDILSNEEDYDTISWLPHGRSFIIYKKKKFAAQALPKYFKATKFTSFTRKLNRWGFTRVTRGPEMGSYYHKLFLRDDQGLCLRMSSHSSSKFQEQHNQLMPAPMGMVGGHHPSAGQHPGAAAAWGMPFGMGGMAGGMNPMAMAAAAQNAGMMGGGPPGGDLAQQNQMINQQLQQLQWQQFQLHQMQQQHGGGHPGHMGGHPQQMAQHPHHAVMQHQMHGGGHHPIMQQPHPGQHHPGEQQPLPGQQQQMQGHPPPHHGQQQQQGGGPPPPPQQGGPQHSPHGGGPQQQPPPSDYRNGPPQQGNPGTATMTGGASQREI